MAALRASSESGAKLNRPVPRNSTFQHATAAKILPKKTADYALMQHKGCFSHAFLLRQVHNTNTTTQKNKLKPLPVSFLRLR